MDNSKSTMSNLKFMNKSKDEMDNYLRTLKAALKMTPGLAEMMKTGTGGHLPDHTYNAAAKRLGFEKKAADPWSADQKDDIDKELNEMLFSYVVQTVGDKPLLEKLYRDHDDDGYAAVERIKKEWATDGNESRLATLVSKRNDLCREGIAKLDAPTTKTFADMLQKMCDELAGTDYVWNGPMMIAHLMDAVGVHDPQFVRNFKTATKSAALIAAKDYSDVVRELLDQLEDNDRIEKKAVQRESARALQAQARVEGDARMASLEAQLAQMAASITALAVHARPPSQGGGGAGRYGTQVVCNDCGRPHRGICFGKELVTGAQTRAQLIAAATGPMKDNNTPETWTRVFDSSERAYREHQGITAAQPASGRKRLAAAVQVVDAQTAAMSPTVDEYDGGPRKVGVDSKADMHFLPDPRFFPGGLTPTDIRVQVADGRMLTPMGVGTAVLIGTDRHGDEFELELQNAVCIPQLAALISVDKLWSDSGVLATFGDKCMLEWTRAGPDMGVTLAFSLQGYYFTCAPPPSLACDADQVEVAAAADAVQTMLDVLTAPPANAGYTHAACGAFTAEETATRNATAHALIAICDSGQLDEVVLKNLITRGRRGNCRLPQREEQQLYARRFPVGAAKLREMVAVTDGLPDSLRTVTDEAIADEVKLAANHPRVFPPSRDGGDLDHCGELTVTDLGGPYGPAVGSGDMNGAVYRCKFVDAKSNMHTTAFLPRKSDYPNRLRRYLNSHEGRNGWTFKGGTLYCDNEVVLNSAEVEKICVEYGLTLANSCVREPWQNGKAERSMGTSARTSREMLLRGGGGKDISEYWAFAEVQSDLVHNVTLHGGQEQTPWAAAHGGEKPNVAPVRVMFCRAYWRVPPERRDDKWQGQALRCVHLGSSTSKAGYVLQILEGARKGEFITSSQVTFNEALFPLHPGFAESAESCDAPPAAEYWPDIGLGAVDDDDDAHAAGDAGGAALLPPAAGGRPQRHTANIFAPGRAAAPVLPYTAVAHAVLADTCLHTAYATAVDGMLATMPAAACPPAPAGYKGIERLPEGALKARWRASYHKEAGGHFESAAQTLKWVQRPAGRITLHRLLVLNSYKAAGDCKTRIVLDGSTVSPDMHGRTFSPVAHHSTIRGMVSLAAEDGHVLGHGDVTMAFTHAKKADTDMPTYAYPLPEYPAPAPDMVLEVGNLNGHPTGSRNWYLKFVHDIKAFARDLGGTAEVLQSDADHCLFRITAPDGEVMRYLIYVDDCLDSSVRGSALRAALYAHLGKCMPIKDLGQPPAFDFVGGHFEQSHRGDTTTITITSPDHIGDLMSRFGTPGGLPVDYPTPCTKEIVEAVAAAKGGDGVDMSLFSWYASCVGALMFIGSTTRPDVVYAINMLSRCQHCPTPRLAACVMRVVYYLVATKHLGLHYSSSGATGLSASLAPTFGGATVDGFVDADHAVTRSTSGYCFFGGAKAAIGFGTQGQPSVALHSMEAEVMATSLAACEALWWVMFHEDAGKQVRKPLRLNIDNKAAIDFSHDPVHRSKARHIHRRHLHLRELIATGEVVPKYVKSDDNTADIFTKPLSKSLFLKHRATLLNMV